jgi:ATP-dependent helicase HrpA
VRAQLETLMSGDFPAGVSALLWPHLPRYLKAMRRRLDKAPGNQKRDAELASRIAPAVLVFEQIRTQAQGAQSRTELDRLQWLIEELRVSLFAQDLRTAAPVSEKRVAEQIEKARAEARL